MSSPILSRRHILGAAAGAAAATLLPVPLPAEGRSPRALAGPAVRRNVYHLALDAADLEAYRAAVTVMKGRPDSDGRSWAAQAAIHGTWNPGNFPLSDRCVHNNWWFLPWHRAYLYYFERIVREASGKPDFALPYWNYSYADQRRLPEAFRPASSPLRDGTRFPGWNTGAAELDIGDIGYLTALGPTEYITPPGGAPAGFGGSAVAAPSDGGFRGPIENTPHGDVHVSVGGNMGQFETAGLDPIFWLHHCNLDRLWNRWHQFRGTPANPTTDSAWLNQTFQFYDETGAQVTIAVKDLLDTRALGYMYDDDPCPPPRFIAVDVRPAREIVIDCRRFPRICEFRIDPREFVPPNIGPRPGPGPDPSPWFRLAALQEPLRVVGAAPVALPVRVDKLTWDEAAAMLRADSAAVRRFTLRLEVTRVTPGSRLTIEVGLPVGGRREPVWVQAASLSFFRSGRPMREAHRDVELLDVTEALRLVLLDERRGDSLLWRVRHTSGRRDVLTGEPLPPNSEAMTELRGVQLLVQ